ncbi:MAG: STAS domain-containing protein, partial [Firmicutes bacterium]|nr:STAS domain-containing protein [Bacillota bacterium]
MNVIYKDNDVTIYLEGRIDSVNAAETEKDLLKALSFKFLRKIIFSLKDLKYISSAGLRILLKVKKQYPNIIITDVPEQIYEIFDMTGFTNILDIEAPSDNKTLNKIPPETASSAHNNNEQVSDEKPLREFSVECCEIISDTNTSTVYRISQENILKLLKGKNTRKKAEEELKRAKTAFMGGVSTAIPFEIVSCDSSFGLIYELLDCRTLGDYISKHPEETSKCAVRFAQLLHDVHSLDIDLSNLPNIKDIFMQYLDNSRTVYTKEETDILDSLVSAMPDDNRFIHNNFTPQNVMVRNNELILIEMSNVCC